MDLRVQLIQDYEEGESISSLAEVYGVSRKTVYKWLARHEAEGIAGLADRSRTPHDDFDVFPAVVSVPGQFVSTFPFRLRHVQMRNRDVVQIIFVEVRIHRDALRVQRLVILRTG